MFAALRLIIGLQLLALAIGDSTVQKEILENNEKAPCLHCSSYEEVVRRALEGVRDLPAINPSLNISSVNTDVDVGATRLHVEFTGPNLQGLPGFTTEEVVYSGRLNDGILNLTLSFSELLLTGDDYVIDGIVAGVLYMNGRGAFDLKFGNALLVASAEITIGVFPSRVNVKNLIADVTAQDLSFYMENILGDLSGEFNKMMSEIGLEILTLYKEQIDQALATYLENLLNRLLGGGGTLEQESHYLDKYLNNFETDLHNIFETLKAI